MIFDQRFFSVLVLLFSLNPYEASRMNGFINGKPIRSHIAELILGHDSVADCNANPTKYGVNILNFTQPLDHFDPDNKVKWQQQVQWKNSTFKPNTEGDVVFLLIGGEEPAPLPWICFMNFTWTKLAEEHNAFMFQLEHRYFGNSIPTPNMSVPNLKWLTTDQALADINAFIPEMNKMFNFNRPKWVAFGGSYAGTLAALLRVLYPNITNGNVASSAPMWAKLDFWEYAQKMEEVILWESQMNANNAKCYNETNAAFAYMRSAVYTEEGREELNCVYNITPPLGKNFTTIDLDVINFLTTILDPFIRITLYTYVNLDEATINATGLNVNNLCSIMVDQSKNYTQRLYDVYNWESQWDSDVNPTFLENDYWDGIAPIQNISFTGDLAAYRGWKWLSCNEFGWFQTTSNGYSIFQNLAPLSFYLQYCTDLFDKSINNDYMQNGVSATFQKWGLPQNYNASNIVLPNGSLDPWSPLGCNVTDNAVHRIAVTTTGGAHCVDMFPYSKSSLNSVEPDAVEKTIDVIKQNVAYFLTLSSPFEKNPPQTNLASPTCVSMAVIAISSFVYLICRLTIEKTF